MTFLGELYIRARESLVATRRGQTYSEYALIFVCVVIALITGYQVIGHTVSSTVSGMAVSVAAA